VEDVGVELRPLLRPPTVEPARLAATCRAIERITGMIERGEPTDAVVAAFNEHCGHRYLAADFAEYWASRSLGEFALEAARPVAPRIADITRDELAELVRRIQAADADTDYYLGLFIANVPHPEAADLIFWPPPGLAHASADQIVDAALRHRPIAL
jgi:hypothetical protein